MAYETQQLPACCTLAMPCWAMLSCCSDTQPLQVSCTNPPNPRTLPHPALQTLQTQPNPRASSINHGLRVPLCNSNGARKVKRPLAVHRMPALLRTEHLLARTALLPAALHSLQLCANATGLSASSAPLLLSQAGDIQPHSSCTKHHRPGLTCAPSPHACTSLLLRLSIDTTCGCQLLHAAPAPVPLPNAALMQAPAALVSQQLSYQAATCMHSRLLRKSTSSSSHSCCASKCSQNSTRTLDDASTAPTAWSPYCSSLSSPGSATCLPAYTAEPSCASGGCP